MRVAAAVTDDVGVCVGVLEGVAGQSADKSVL
jgi:hypothetical protein